MRVFAAVALTASTLCAQAPATSAQGKVDFASDVLPFLESKCFSCHGEPKRDAKGKLKEPKGGLRLDGKDWILRGGDGEDAVVAGELEESGIYRRVALPEDDPDFMPSKGEHLTADERDTLKRWIEEGASFGSWTGAAVPKGAPKAASRPTIPKLQSPYHSLVQKLESSAPKLSPRAITKAAGDSAQITAIAPRSKLLRVEFRASEQQTDDKRLAKLKTVAGNVTQLNLARTAVTDKGLAALTKMPRLTRLDLHETGITDRGIQHLKRLRELRSLNLYGTDVTDEALATVAQLPSLETLYVWQTKITARGLAELEQRNPKLRVVSKPVWPAAPQVERDQGRRRRRR